MQYDHPTRPLALLGRIVLTTYVDAAYCYRPSSVVCRSVTLGLLVSHAKTTEPIEMPFGLWVRMGPRKDVLDGPRFPMRMGNY